MSKPTINPADQLIADVIEAHLEAGLRPEESAVRLISMAFSLLASIAGPQEARRYIEDKVIPHVVTLQVKARAEASRAQAEARQPSQASDPLFLQSTPRGRQ